ncbi:MAG: MiaB/RimO family radical SAM methylthiotransferase [Planctomycetota bacterium]|nr:MiaB/RimO family radical SAM methylthiotransferase [Planctomycetota bacterium]
MTRFVHLAPSNPTYHLRTLGCRVNHAEAREIESLLQERGFDPAPASDPADLEIVHTCAVTTQAAAKSRHAIRRAARGNGNHAPTVIVTGCWPSADPDQAAALSGGTHNAFGHRDDEESMMQRLSARIDRWLADEGRRPGTGERTPQSEAHDGLRSLPVLAPPARPGRHVRAEVHIQDGCDAHCTFCIIPTLRPTLRSKPEAVVVEEVKRLVDLGHREIVLTGIFLGAYGHETALRRRQRNPQAEPLADLLDAVASVDGVTRLRLSSMEPGDVTEPLLDSMIANRPVVVPHLHLPLQSGSDAILHRMNRQYRVEQYTDMIQRVQEAFTDPVGLPPAITTDIICGFPGESEDDFARTVEVAQRTGYLHMHVFPFSPRRGTAAARWTDRFVPDAVIRRRVRHLIDLEEDPTDGLSIRWRRQLLGRSVRVILEREDSDGWMSGRCDHYAMIRVPTPHRRNDTIHVRVTHVSPGQTAGRALDIDHPLKVLETMEAMR